MCIRDRTNSDTTALSSSLALLNKKLAGIFVTPSKKATWSFSLLPAFVKILLPNLKSAKFVEST